MNVSDYNIWYFDCDGVLLDSNRLKTKVFYEVALPYGEENAKALQSYHEKLGGISRFEKFQYFFEVMLGKKSYQYEYENALEQFGVLTKEKMATCDETVGLRDLLEKLNSLTNCYVVSGGAQDELRDVFKIRQLAGYFTGIYGSPDNKLEILERIHRGTHEKNAVFVGDSRYDYEAASSYGIDFIFMTDYTEFEDWPEYFQNKSEVKIINNLAEIGAEL
jgi:phosphoglycolate phosphatase-like HAD superfamily hydrolase